MPFLFETFQTLCIDCNDLTDFTLLKEIGEREGKFYAINVPLKDGIDDPSFTRLFKTVSLVLCSFG